MLLTSVGIALLPVMATQASAHGTQVVKRASAPKINLTFSWWGNATRDALTEKAIAYYEKLHPNVHITPQFNGNFDDYFKKLTVQASGGSEPDIIQMDYDYISAFGDRGALLNLAPYHINTKNISQSLLKDGMLGGKLYGIPNSINAYALFYNPVLMKKAGIKVTPNTRWTWSQFAAVVKKIHNKLGIYGTDDPEDYEHFGYYVRQTGKPVYSANQKSVGYPAITLQNWFTYWNNLRNAKAIPNEAVTLSQQMGHSNDPFMAGKSASIFYWANLYESLGKMTNQPVAMMLPPTMPGGKEGMYLKPSQFWSISATTKHPKQSAAFVNFLLNNLQANQDMGTDRGIPVSSIIRKDMERTANKASKPEFAYFDKAAAVTTTPLGTPPPVNNDQALAQATTILQEVGYGQLSAKQGAEQTVSQMNQILGN